MCGLMKVIGMGTTPVGDTTRRFTGRRYKIRTACLRNVWLKMVSVHRVIPSLPVRMTICRAALFVHTGYQRRQHRSAGGHVC